MKPLTIKQKIFLASYPFIHVLLFMGFLLYGFSLCLDPTDTACKEQGTFIGWTRNVSMNFARILMMPLEVLKVKSHGINDYILIFGTGILYGIILVVFYKVVFKK